MPASVLIGLGAGLLVYGLSAVGAHFLSLRMIFPHPPLSYGPGPEIFWLDSGGCKLAARYWRRDDAAYTILYLHGNYEDLGSIAEYIPALVEAGYSVFAFDYRRYGLSTGTPSEAALYADTERAYRHLRDELKIPAQRILVFGYSLGGGPAVELARRHPVAGIILQGAFVSAYRVITRWPLFPGDKFQNLSKIGSLRCPILVIHGSDDGTVPCWHGRALFQAITSAKQSLFIAGGPHAGLADYAGAEYWAALQRFTNSL